MDDYNNYYFKYISGIIAEGQEVTLEILPSLNDKTGSKIKRVVHDERENGLYITYKGVRYYEAYHIEF